MRLLTLVFSVVLLSSACYGQASSQEKCSVEGRVTSASTGEPLRKASLRLYSNGGGQQGMGAKTFTAISDAGGHFLIENVDAGTYRLMAQRQGYIFTQYGARNRQSPGTELRLSPGQKLNNLNFSLIRQGIIAGRVFDEDGEPMERAMVNVFRYGWRNGKRQMEQRGGGSTNDRGEFRISGISPGKYYVSANPMQQMMVFGTAGSQGQIQKPTEQEIATYYPNAVSEEGAMPLQVDAGQELGGIDIQLRKSAVYSVKGRVTGLAANESGGRMGMSHIMASRKGESPMMGFSRGGAIKPDGAFEIPNLAPGSYDLMVRNRMGMSVVGRTTVEIGNQNVDGIVIETQPPRQVQGSIRMEGDNQAKLSGMQVWLRSADGMSGVQPNPAKEDGSFTIDNVGADKYDVQVMGMPDNAYLKAVHVGGGDSPDRIVDLSTGAGGNLELILSARGAQIQGTVKREDGSMMSQGIPAATANSGGGIPGAGSNGGNGWRVVLIPDTQDLQKRDRDSKTGAFDQYGSFTIRGIAPGNYKLFAWENLQDEAWRNPDFLKQVESKGMSVSVAEGEQKQAQPTLVPSTATDELMAKLGMQ